VRGCEQKTITKATAKNAVNFMYAEIMKIDKPKYVIFLDSPLAIQLACNLIKNSKLGAKLDSQLGSQLDSQLGPQLRSQLYSQLGSQLRSQLYSQLGPQLRSQLYSQLDLQLDSQLGSEKFEHFGFSWANWWYHTAYYGFYDYVLHELFPKKDKDFKLFGEYLKHSQELHYTMYFKEIAFVSDFPKEIHRNERHQLHSFDKAALLYRDSWALYYSNGIRVSKEFTETKPESFTKEMIIKETNADIRAQMLLKIGNDRLNDLLDSKVIDKDKDYELITFDVGDGRVRPFLKMKCPSTGKTHIEGTLPIHKTVNEAWAFQHNEPKREGVKVVWQR